VTDAPASSRADRYGRPAPWRRRAVVVGSGLVGALALTWLAWTTFFHASPEVSSELVGWDVVDDHVVTARIDVVIRGGGIGDIRPTCLVRAIATDHVVVGEATYVPQDGRNEVELRTERRATSVENVGCTTPSQPRPR
jgi:hypothetical protein